MSETPTNLQQERDSADLSLREILRNVGLVQLHCGVEGALKPESEAESDWFLRLFHASPLFRHAVRQATGVWANETEPSLTEVLPGCWCVPLPRDERRRRIGYSIILIVCDEFLEAEHLRALCQSARVDFEICIRFLGDLPPVRVSDIGRLAQLVRCLHADHFRLHDSDETMEKVSQQLAESYEEISLLYMISQSMNVVQRPHRFVTIACEGLLDTLAYDWIGARFADNDLSLRSLAGRLIFAGTPVAPQSAVIQATKNLMDQLTADAPVILDPATNPDVDALKTLGKPLLVHPVSRDGRLIGALFAGNKNGPDTKASSADMKLLAATASHMGIFLENAALYEDMNAMFLGTLEALTASIDAKDRYTCGHSQRVAHLSQLLAMRIGLEEEEVRRVNIAGLVHDVGKIGVPESVLCKPGRLTDEEFDRIKEHPKIGHRILKDIPQLRDVLPGVLYHHERWDGAGYPEGLAGKDIPLLGRLIALADSFDAMSSNRTYRSARDREAVLQEITQCAGSQFDPELAPLFVKLDFSGFDKLLAEHQAVDLEHPDMRGEAA